MGINRQRIAVLALGRSRAAIVVLSCRLLGDLPPAEMGRRLAIGGPTQSRQRGPGRQHRDRARRELPPPDRGL
ncbi:MAG: hypothetical protein EA400_13865 [Chromatiaceae bacterium]|nr:MAG: hypothetical protein EA400_13865 [Chromatiaceae bacterium]